MLLHRGEADRIQPAELADGALTVERLRDDVAPCCIAEREEQPVGPFLTLESSYNHLVVGYASRGRCQAGSASRVSPGRVSLCSCSGMHEGGTLSAVGDLLLRDVRPWPREPGLGTVDVVIRDGRIAAGPAPSGVPVADGRGGVLVPAFADVHAHLDSTRLGLPFRPHTAEPGLAGLIAQRSPELANGGGFVGERATRTLGAAIISGATAVRTHAQVDTDCGLERLEGVLAAREAPRGAG